MCGITGIVDLRGDRSIDESVLKRMNGLLTHRGPDGDGFHFSPGVGFGHRRLSIIDLEGGKLTLKHADIKSLDMPAMTMVFVVKDKAVLEALKLLKLRPTSSS